MAHFLNRERMRVVNKDDKGRVTYRKSYRFGDEVDTSKMEDHRVEALTESSALVTSKDDLRTRRQGLVPYPGSRVTGAATGDPGGQSAEPDAPDEDDSTFDVPDEENTNSESTNDDEDEDSEQVDAYTSMDYGDLQQTAKSRGLNAGGSADDLRARLRDADDS